MLCRFFRRILIACTLAALHVAIAGLPVEAEAAEVSAEDREFFERQVRPLLVKRCFACHGGTKAGGGLSLQTAAGWRKGGDSGPAIVPGKPDESLLIEAINYGSLEMPPADQGGRLPAEEIAVLTDWIARGAPDPRDGSDLLGGMTREQARTWWAFQPLPTLDPAGMETGTETQTDADVDAADVARIDRLVERELARRGLVPAPPADRRALIRRLTYDLTGLPPTPAEVDAFLADRSPAAWSRTVDRLLDSPQYGVHWGRHWLDVVRYADTAGENTDRPLPHAWRYRNWVIESFHRDLPFDQFVRLQLAGDLLAGDQPDPQRAEGIIATGYLAIARRFGHDIDKDMHLTYEDVIDNLGKNFLGLTLGCARCHDHKYDPVSAADYYALVGIFDSTRFAFPGCEPKGQPRDLVPLLAPEQVEERMQSWRAKVAEVEAEKLRRQASARSATDKLQSAWNAARRTLVEAKVPEGASVPFEQRLSVRRGEVVLLSVAPNAGHGADSTLVEWSVRETGGSQRRWSVADLVADLLKGNAWSAADDASWSFLEVTTTPVFLTERRERINGNAALQAWSLGSEPSVFVNAADQPVMVWTNLPAKTFFVHPGPNRPVAVAWTSPLDGQILLEGRVADAHPAGLDGVAFQLEHVADPAVGAALADVGQSVVSQPEAGPPPTIPVAYAVVEGQARNARVHQRGDPDKLGDEVPRRWLTVFGGQPLSHESESGRRELADWVAGHPLLARVIVNRIWQWHFGRGLVASSNDFGSRGELPTHPELLDFLAARFVRDGYRIKPLHRLILQTEAYRRASGSPTADDPDNRWLAHFTRRRLTAEELRDSLLAVSGQLDLSAGEAHPFPEEASWTFTQHAPFHAVYPTNRRSAFLMVQRQRRHPFLALFDGADPNASTPARESTTVPTQALYFLNDPFFHQQAERLAARLLADPPDDAGREAARKGETPSEVAPQEAAQPKATQPKAAQQEAAPPEATPDADSRLRRAFREVFQREPTPAERERARRFLAAYPGDEAAKWSALARVLLASNEFLYVD